MPLRLLEYDIAEYLRQIRRLKRRNKEQGGLTREELLSGIRRTDRLTPAATLVFYHGKEPWNAPLELAELLDLSGVDKTISGLLVNHRICVISLADLDENNFRTGLRELIGMMKRRDDKKAMLSFCMEHEERFSHLDDETYDIICLALNLKTLALERKNSRNGGKENDNDMCKAFRDLMHDSKMEGKREGKREGENMFARLISSLLTEDRLEDVKKATQNLAFRQKLYQEYGIQ